MIKELCIEELMEYMEELSESDAFELCEKDGDVYIPYMMNDAVECFLHLSKARLSTPWPEDYKGEIRCFFMADKDRELCLIPQDGDRCSLSYEKAFLEMHCYQYHRIGHQWRREAGEEKWRRLVNLLCVLHDKYHYLGEEACHPLECRLWPLIEFAPLCYFTPINESIAAWYPETDLGIQTMEMLAKEAEDVVLGSLIREYSQGKKSLEEMAAILLRTEHQQVFQFIEKLMEEASSFWPQRPYFKDPLYDEMRKQKEEEYRARGYKGRYPFMYVEDGGKRRKEILFVEEHPFTVLDWKDYTFRIHVISI